MKNESGFTLIEIIVSLVLVGMMAAIAGMGIVTGTKGYMLAKENSHMAQKAQLAMARIQRELMELTDIAARQVNPAFIIYDNTSGRHAIARDTTDNTIKMFDLLLTANDLPSMDDGDILVDNVNNFTLNYYRGLNDWNFGSDNINLLSAIKSDLALDRSDGSGDAVTFSTTVNPRNTNNYGGVSPTATPNTAHNYSCFVATAADGDFDPPTMLLFSLAIVAVVLLFLLPLNRKAGKLEGLEVWKLKHLSASRLHSLLASKPPGLPTSQPPSLPAVLPVLRQNKGNVLIGLIVTMMIFAALGAGMVAMTGTSTSSQVTANTTSKAYYLAESGFRYAASQYLNATDADTPPNGIEDDRNTALILLHDSTEFTLSNSDERFSLEVYPYFFITTGNHSAGSTTINARFAGAMPAGFDIPSNGRLRIGTGIYNYTIISGQLAITPGLLEAIDDRMNILPVGIPSGAATIRRGENLTLVSASFFPMITGKFMIDGITYKYDTKNGHTLQNITDANHPAQPFTISVNSSTNVVLKPYLRVFSTGTVGQGDQAASRQIIYNVPIPDSPTEGVKVEFHDEFVDKLHWKDPSILGSHIISGGGLKVFTTQISGGVEASLIGLNWRNTNANLASAHSLSGYFLSYDAQVKVGFDPSTVPNGGFCDPFNIPPRVPCDYAAGLSFRLDESNNSYGVSFMRANSMLPFMSHIDNAIVPHYDIPMIVLWQQTNPGSGMTRNWLAYKYLNGPVIYSDDMENDPPIGWNWDNSTFAHNQWTLSSIDSHRGLRSWIDSPAGEYENDEVASLITRTFNLTGVSSAVLTFWHKYSLENGYDFAYVDISTDSGNTWNPIPIAEYTGSLINWGKAAIDISGYLPNVTIRFRIETDFSNTRDGWYIDDVTISEGFPVNDATLLVRIKEAAATVDFDTISGWTTPIEDGDIITQANGAQGTVVGNPILSAGSWAAAGSAEGIITLNKVSGTFSDSQALRVGGSNFATFDDFTARNNYIKVFYGDLNAYGAASNDPFDIERLGNLRNEIRWPHDEIADWSADRDFFTLIQWDGVNSVDIIDSIDEPGVIVLGTESLLFTPDSGILSYARPEFGLHTFGHGSTNVYFDDFGILVEIASGSGFLTPIQE